MSPPALTIDELENAVNDLRANEILYTTVKPNKLGNFVVAGNAKHHQSLSLGENSDQEGVNETENEKESKFKNGF